MSTKNSVCARGSNPEVEVAAEELTLTLQGSLLTAAKAKGLTVWYSNLSSSNTLGVNLGLGHIVALHHRSSASYHIH